MLRGWGTPPRVALSMSTAPAVYAACTFEPGDPPLDASAGPWTLATLAWCVLIWLTYRDAVCGEAMYERGVALVYSGNVADVTEGLDRL